MEGQIGYFRRNHFVPVPEVSSLAEPKEMVEQWNRQDGARRIGSRSRTIVEDFALEQPLQVEFPVAGRVREAVDHAERLPWSLSVSCSRRRGAGAAGRHPQR